MLCPVVATIAVVEHHDEIVWILIGRLHMHKEVDGQLEAIQEDVVLVMLEHKSSDRNLVQISLDDFLGGSSINNYREISLAHRHDHL